MSYPKYDFRTQLLNNSSNLLDSLILEPWPELIRNWHQINRSDHLETFRQAIYFNLSNQRYDPRHLISLFSYPEFYSTCLLGLKSVWVTYPINYQVTTSGPMITIGEHPNTLTMLDHDKLHLIDHIQMNSRCIISVNGISSEVGIWMTDKVRASYHLINQLERLV